MDEFKTLLKKEIIRVLNLNGMQPEEIDDDAPLFGEGLGLDSIDALELIVMLEKNYGIKLAKPEDGKVVFQSVNTLAGYIEANRTK